MGLMGLGCIPVGPFPTVAGLPGVVLMSAGLWRRSVSSLMEPLIAWGFDRGADCAVGLAIWPLACGGKVKKKVFLRGLKRHTSVNGQLKMWRLYTSVCPEEKRQGQSMCTRTEKGLISLQERGEGARVQAVATEFAG